MEEQVSFCKALAAEKMRDSISHLNLELSKIRAGRANTSVLDGLLVDYYGTPTSLNNMASLSTPDARTIIIQPWEKQVLSDIINAINSSNLGFVAQDTGDKIIINMPILTEERRRDLVKQAKIEVENCKVGIRNSRRDANDELKKLNKNGLSDDVMKIAESEIQSLTNKFIDESELLFEARQKDILTV